MLEGKSSIEELNLGALAFPLASRGLPVGACLKVIVQGRDRKDLEGQGLERTVLSAESS